MLRELFSGTKTRRTDVHSIAWFTYRIGTFHSDTMRQVAHACVALDLQTWLIDSYKITQQAPVRNTIGWNKPLEWDRRSLTLYFIRLMLALPMRDSHGQLPRAKMVC